MNIKTAKEIVVSVIKESLDNDIEVFDEMSLIGSDALLDSMKLVEICLALEDKADDLGFEFNWTSEAALSNSRSIFRNIKSLAEEFSRQSGN